MNLTTGCQVGLELDPRISIWAGSVQHELVETLLVSSPRTSEIDSRMLRKLEVVSMNFNKTLLCLYGQASNDCWTDWHREKPRRDQSTEALKSSSSRHQAHGKVSHNQTKATRQPHDSHTTTIHHPNNIHTLNNKQTSSLCNHRCAQDWTSHIPSSFMLFL